MDLSEAISEPFVQLIDFHNAFNRGIKVSFGGRCQTNCTGW